MAKRSRGAQPANRNALKHGFYAKTLTEAEKVDLETAADITGLDDEIALLRVKIKHALERDPDNLDILLDASTTLARLVKLRYGLTEKDSHSIQDNIVKVLTELGGPIITTVLSKTILKGG
ncbi:MAG: hypothetical protein WC455_21035 [Dehalococcoidia bacterium]|jgi:hypothetical protein